jgi:hypothetical protein
MCLLLAALIIKPSLAGFVFVVITASFNITLDDLGGMLYYPAAAFGDLIIITLTALLKVSIMMVRLLYISIVSIFLNVGGWVLWLYNFPPMIYDSIFMLLYIIAAVTIIAGNGDGLRMVRTYFRRFNIRRFNIARFDDNTKGSQ